MTTYTYSKLGTNGAAGNQLWQIAGTIGIAEKAKAKIAFPDWYYKKYFYMPDEYFLPPDPHEDVIDLSPDYLQDIGLWNDSDTVREVLSFSMHSWELVYDKYVDVLSEDIDLIAVHVRRGNNVQLPDHHPVLPVEYFEQALDVVGDGQVVVFSDDIGWCKKQSLFDDAYFATGNDPSVNVYDLTGPAPLSLDTVMTDLAFMAQCDKHVISNSSFSWWGAYLAYGLKVVFPGRWYGPKLKHINTSVMFPAYWTRMDLPQWHA